MSIKQDNSGSVAVLKKASDQLKALKSEISLAYAQSINNDQTAIKARILTLTKISEIEKEVKIGLEQYVKQVSLRDLEHRNCEHVHG